MKVLYMPVDLPNYEYADELVKNFTGINPENNNKAKEFAYQKFTTNAPNYGNSNWINYGSLEKYLESILPIKQLVNIRINHYIKGGGMHCDFLFPDKNKKLWDHNNKLEPCGYHMVLEKNKNIKNPCIEKSNGDVVWCELPDDTNWYVIRSTETLHGGLNYDPTRYILFTHFWVRESLHSEILERSIGKYKEYIIYDE